MNPRPVVRRALGGIPMALIVLLGSLFGLVVLVGLGATWWLGKAAAAIEGWMEA